MTTAEEIAAHKVVQDREYAESIDTARGIMFGTALSLTGIVLAAGIVVLFVLQS